MGREGQEVSGGPLGEPGGVERAGRDWEAPQRSGRGQEGRRGRESLLDSWEGSGGLGEVRSPTRKAGRSR